MSIRRNVEKVKAVDILDPDLCVHCRHAYVASVVTGDGERKNILYCTRRDCDNWRVESELSAGLEAALFRKGEPADSG